MFRKAADGTGQVERLKPGAANPYAWTADGRLIFEADGDLGVFSPEGEGDVDILLDEEFFLFGPALSQDGRWLAYHSTERDRSAIVVRPFPQHRRRPVECAVRFWPPSCLVARWP